MLVDIITLFVETPWLAYLVVGLLGLCVGSFLNVVIYRTPLIMQQAWRNDCTLFLHPDTPLSPELVMTLSKPASTCTCCGHRIRWYENIPVISWLALRGKCSACQNPISIRYPVVELITMLTSITVLVMFGPTAKMLFALLLTWALIALTGIDFDTQLLPDRITLPLGGLGLLVNAQSMFVSPSTAIWGYVLGFLMLWVVYVLFKVITGKEGMGYGDFKLLAALGAWLGYEMLLPIVLLSSIVGAMIGVILLRVNKQNMPFAFGPYLAIAGWICLLWGNQLVSAYLGLY